LLKLAIDAQLPLIEVSTPDLLNFADVVKFITKKKAVVEWGTGPAEIKTKTIYYHIWSATAVIDYRKLYDRLAHAESSLIIVNPNKGNSICFQAGELPVPKDMVLDFIVAIVSDKAKAASLMSALGGCTLKEVAEAVRLTMSRDKSITTQGLTLTRKTCFRGSSGLTQVDTSQTFYAPPEALVDFATKEGSFFLNGSDLRLVPRGILANGPPGVGKTEAAKWIAHTWGVPLFRVDISGAKSKWHGESEQNVTNALSQLDNEEPCVVLFDEIEKVFGGGDGSDFGGSVTKSVLGQLLWWLAEHRSRVFVVMTTNAHKKLPPELYREGRIDKVLTFHGLSQPDVEPFAQHLLLTYPSVKIPTMMVKSKLKGLLVNHIIPGSDPPCVSQAAVSDAVKSMVKASLLK